MHQIKTCTLLLLLATTTACGGEDAVVDTSERVLAVRMPELTPTPMPTVPPLDTVSPSPVSDPCPPCLLTYADGRFEGLVRLPQPPFVAPAFELVLDRSTSETLFGVSDLTPLDEMHYAFAVEALNEPWTNDVEMQVTELSPDVDPRKVRLRFNWGN